MTKTIKMTHLLYSVFTSHPPAKDNSTHFCVQPCWRMSAVLLLWRCPLTLRPTQHYYDKLLSASWLIYKPWTDNNRPFHNSLLFYWSFQRWTSSEHIRSVTESETPFYSRKHFIITSVRYRLRDDSRSITSSMWSDLHSREYTTLKHFSVSALFILLGSTYYSIWIVPFR